MFWLKFAHSEVFPGSIKVLRHSHWPSVVTLFLLCGTKISTFIQRQVIPHQVHYKSCKKRTRGQTRSIRCRSPLWMREWRFEHRRPRGASVKTDRASTVLPLSVFFLQNKRQMWYQAAWWFDVSPRVSYDCTQCQCHFSVFCFVF